MAGELRGAASAMLCRRRLKQLHAGGTEAVGAYVAHCAAADVTLVGEDAASGAVLAALALQGPLLVLTQRCLVVLADGGLGEAAVLQLAGQDSWCSLNVTDSGNCRVSASCTCYA